MAAEVPHTLEYKGGSSQHQPELRPTKDFKAKYYKVKAKPALLSSSASASKASIIKNKGLIAEAYECDEEVSSDDNEMVEVKVLMELAEDNDVVSKEGMDIKFKDKNEAKLDKTEHGNGKSARKAKPKAYSFLMGQLVPT
ncbi:hypothetical protein Tco_0676146 [Tanacetum coccineum]